MSTQEDEWSLFYFGVTFDNFYELRTLIILATSPAVSTSQINEIILPTLSKIKKLRRTQFLFFEFPCLERCVRFTTRASDLTALESCHFSPIYSHQWPTSISMMNLSLLSSSCSDIVQTA